MTNSHDASKRAVAVWACQKSRSKDLSICSILPRRSTKSALMGFLPLGVDRPIGTAGKPQPADGSIHPADAKGNTRLHCAPRRAVWDIFRGVSRAGLTRPHRRTGNSPTLKPAGHGRIHRDIGAGDTAERCVGFRPPEQSRISMLFESRQDVEHGDVSESGN
jgi:hypothetical protein